MIIRTTRAFIGQEGRFSRGQEVEVDFDRGSELIARGLAELVSHAPPEQDAPAEKAKPAPKNKAKPKPKTKGRR